MKLPRGFLDAVLRETNRIRGNYSGFFAESQAFFDAWKTMAEGWGKK